MRSRNLKSGITTFGRIWRIPNLSILLSLPCTRSLCFLYLGLCNCPLSPCRHMPLWQGRWHGHREGGASILMLPIMAEAVWYWTSICGAAPWFLGLLSDVTEALSEGKFWWVVLKVVLEISTLSLLFWHFCQPPNYTKSFFFSISNS